MTRTTKSSPARETSGTKAVVRSNITKPPAINAAQSPIAPETPAGKPPSKQAQLAALLTRDEGATLDHMVAATGWLPHTTRAALTGLRKRGYAISSDKLDGVRTYRAVVPQ